MNTVNLNSNSISYTGNLWTNDYSYTFTLNDKPVNGKLLSLLTDIETV